MSSKMSYILCTKLLSRNLIKRFGYTGIRWNSYRSLPSTTATGYSKNDPTNQTKSSDDLPTTAYIDDGTTIVRIDKRPKFAFFLNPQVRDEMEVGKYKPSKQPGSRRLITSALPSTLQEACRVVLEGHSMNPLREQARTLAQKIYKRELPLEESTRKERMAEFMAEIKRNEPVDADHPAILAEDKRVLMRQRHKLFEQKVKAEIYDYKPLDFSTPHSCMVYMIARLKGDYTSLVKVLNQLKSSRPDFRPRTMLDFGSGVGSASWAVDNVWPKTCRETFSVDSSAEMNLLNERLQRSGTVDGDFSSRRDATYFRQFLPASASIKHDLIISSRTLFELDNQQMRIRTLDILWKTVNPGGFLVLVEVGTAPGTAVILEARDFLLEGVDASSTRSRGILIAPCPHRHQCPLLLKNKKYRICTDSTDYFSMNDQVLSDVYSYVIFQKPELFTNYHEIEGNSWPRIVQPTRKRGHLVIGRVCNKFGNLQELVITKGKHSPLCYQVARRSHQGDILPYELLPPSEHIVPKKRLYLQMLEIFDERKRVLLEAGKVEEQTENCTESSSQEDEDIKE